MKLVKIRNTHDSKPLRIAHDGLGDVSIPPETEVILDFSYATVAFGHPKTRNAGSDRDRERELRAARTFWGMYPGINEAEWPEIAPRFEVYDMDGNRVWMVMDDPDGTKANPRLTADTDPNASAEARIAELQAQMEQLVKIVAANKSAQAVPTAEASPMPETSASPIEQIPVETETQTERNEARDDLPTPKKRVVSKDGPRKAKTAAKA